jgi:hypothetical protein
MVANIPPRKDINHGTTAPKPPAPMGPHISQATRDALKDQDSRDCQARARSRRHKMTAAHPST